MEKRRRVGFLSITESTSDGVRDPRKRRSGGVKGQLLVHYYPLCDCIIDGVEWTGRYDTYGSVDAA